MVVIHQSTEFRYPATYLNDWIQADALHSLEQSDDDLLVAYGDYYRSMRLKVVTLGDSADDETSADYLSGLVEAMAVADA